MQEHVALHGQRAVQFADAFAAAKDRSPHSAAMQLINVAMNVFSHGYTCTSCLEESGLERSTINSPSSLSHMRSHGSGLGAGPEIFTPTQLNLLPRNGNAMMLS